MSSTEANTSGSSGGAANHVMSVAPPAVTAPTGGGAIRGIGEKVTVDQSSGAARLDIPIFTTPSRQDFFPRLSLGYSSGTGNGPFGLGWTLSVPAVSRKTERGLPTYRDPDDTFILSGAEDLVPALSAVNGAWEALVDERVEAGTRFDVRRFRPRTEGLFARIERWEPTDGTVAHWRSTSRDGVTSVFGRSAAARIADPEQDDHVLSWLLEESRDERGNIIRYEYKPEDGAGTPSKPQERHRRPGDSCVNSYLKRIRYGNAVPGLPGGWQFEVVLDYGEHDPAEPTPDELHAWPARPDAFSSYRGGFEVRTYRLCRRVLMFHRFPELDPKPYLVAATDFSFAENPVVGRLSAVTRRGYAKTTGQRYTTKHYPPLELGYTGAEIDGRVRSVDSGDAGLPAGSAARWVDLDGEGVPGLLTEQGGALFYSANLGASGRPPRDDETPPQPPAPREPAAVRLAPPRVVTPEPSLTNLPAGRQQLMDLAGDGKQDLAMLGGPTPGFYERRDGSWQRFRSFRSTPNVDWQNPNLRLVELGGDGHADVLITEGESVTWYPSLSEDGFGPSVSVRLPVDERDGPMVVFADAAQSVHLADMSGDGLTDIVRIRNGDVSYWPSLGYGRFGAKVTMSRAPHFDHPDRFDPGRLRLADIDGSGTTDIVYLGSGGATIWANESGNGWGDAHPLTTLPPVDDLTDITVVDLLGNGTACLVWSSPLPGAAGRPLRYVALMGGQKPHLLRSVRNNMGAETRISHAPSTRFSLEDQAVGKPWVTRLPFPVHVVERIESRDEVGRTKLVSLYRYHHGYFDGAEREFRGFGLVEQWDTESFAQFSGPGLFDATPETSDEAHLPPTYTKSWFHTGAYLDRDTISRHFADDYYTGDPQSAALADTVLPPGLDADETREACRALRGTLLRRELYADDRTPQAPDPYVVSEHSHAVRRIQGRAANPHAVFLPHHRETVTYHYERNPDDPRTGQELTLEVNEFGDTTKSATISHPRRAGGNVQLPEQGATAIVYTEVDFTEPADDADPRETRPCETRTYELTGVPGSSGEPFRWSDALTAGTEATEIPYESEPTSETTERRLIERVRTLFYRDDLSGPLPPRRVGTPALPFERYQLAFTPGLLGEVYGDRLGDESLSGLLGDEGRYVHHDGGWWVPSGRQVFDPERFYLPVETIDPFGHSSSTTYDDHDQLVVEARDPLDNVIVATNDYRTMQPERVTDQNRNRVAVAFDPLGMVGAIAVMGTENEPGGDTLDDPTTRLEYDLFNWAHNGRPNFVHTFAREQHGTADPRWQQTYLYSDGFGREVSTKIQAEPGPAPARGEDGELLHDENGELVLVDTSPEVRWVGTGRTVFDNKGNPVKQFEPFFSSTPDYEDEAELVEWGVTPFLRYDPLGRLVRTDLPNGTFTHVETTPWSQATADPNDTVLDSRWYVERGSPDPAGDEPSSDPETRAAWLASQHAGTPAVVHLDVLARPFLAVADNGPAGQFETRTTLDIEGNPLVVTDPRGNQAEANRFDLLGRRLARISMDAGERRVLPNVAGNPIRRWDGRGHTIRSSYDELQRPTHLFVRSPDGVKSLIEYVVYGEAPGIDGAGRNLRGQVHRHYDAAGVATNEEFDFDGNLRRHSRRLADGYRQAPDWSPLDELQVVGDIEAAAEALLQPVDDTMTTRTSFDALGRVTSATTPDGSETVYHYNEANLLETVGVRHPRAGEATPFVTSAAYNARGQRERITYARGVTTDHVFDRETFRLSRLETTRNADPRTLQKLSYTYDPVGNVTEIRDDAQQTIFFRNAVVAPHTRYAYDALSWLVRAEGREHAGQNLPEPRDHTEPSRMPLPHPNDAQALRRYTERYEYDKAGNILVIDHAFADGSWTLPYDYATDSNRLLRHGPRPDSQYSYDEHGNMTRIPHHLPKIDWDFEDQMQRVDLRGGGEIFYVYDATGQRVRAVHEHNGSTVEERTYLGRFETYRKTIAGALKLERETLHVMDGEGRLALVETTTHDGGPVPHPAPVIRFQLGDHLGSVRLEVDQDGAVLSYEEYHPYGTTSYHSADGHAEVSLKRYRYTGKERDEHTGLYYHGARYYAPWIGRWTSCDPSGTADSPNLYLCVLNDPLSKIDPDGLQSRETDGKVLALGASRTEHYGIKGYRGLEGVRAVAEASLPGRTVVDVTALWQVEDIKRSWDALADVQGMFEGVASATMVQEVLSGVGNITAIHFDIRGINPMVTSHTGAELRSILVAIQAGNNSKVDVHFLHRGGLSSIKRGARVVSGAPLPSHLKSFLPASFFRPPVGPSGGGGGGNSAKPPRGRFSRFTSKVLGVADKAGKIAVVIPVVHRSFMTGAYIRKGEWSKAGEQVGLLLLEATPLGWLALIPGSGPASPNINGFGVPGAAIKQRPGLIETDATSVRYDPKTGTVQSVLYK